VQEAEASVDLDLTMRAALGKAARGTTPRSSQAEWTPPHDRPDPVGILERQGETRVQELLPIRYGRMLDTAFAFFRGSAAIMAGDLAGTVSSGARVQLCGDAHLANFGSYAAPDRQLLFDVTDFDESVLGPWEWDVKRLAASVCIAGRDRNFKQREIAGAVLETSRAYHQAMTQFADMGNLDIWYTRLDVDRMQAELKENGLERKHVKQIERELDGPHTPASVRELAKLTETVHGRVRFRSQPPLLVPIGELDAAESAEAQQIAHDGLEAYTATLPEERRGLLAEYRRVDMARKVVGVGSVGMRSWVILFAGRDAHDALLLQCKQAQASVLEPYAGASPYPAHGERVVRAQRLMQAATDIFLGWMDTPDRDDYYLRQLADGKGAVDVTGLLPKGLATYGRACGWSLARAHARAGDRIAIASYLGKGDVFDRAMVAFADDYADQNEQDYALLQQAEREGRIVAVKA